MQINCWLYLYGQNNGQEQSWPMQAKGTNSGDISELGCTEFL